MARKPRIHYPGAFYHVMLRGNAGEDIFFQEADRHRFYLLLQEGVERYGFRVHAFCLMSNHVHLALQVGKTPLARIMQNLSFRYTRWINWERKRTGHLFQGRYRAILVDIDTYLLELVAYVHLNPVRAGMTKAPEEYPWSSHRAYVGKETIPWLSTEPVLSQFSSNILRSRKLFGSFVLGRIDEGHRDDLHGKGGLDPRVFGDDSFSEKALRQADEEVASQPGLETLMAVARDFFSVTEEELRGAGQGRQISEVRGILAYAAREWSSASLTDLGRLIGRDVTTLSSAARRIRERAGGDCCLHEKLERVRKAVIGVASLQA